MRDESTTERDVAAPPLSVRLTFWFVLSALSVFFAEVVAGSSPTGFFSVWGLVALIPLYGLQVLLLGALAYRNGPPRIVTLYAAGSVLGLYEAYVTKMLWHHTWSGPQWPIAGISGLAFLQLVLFWHPVMAFMVPVWVGAASTRDGADILPARARDWLSSRRIAARAALLLGAATALFTATGGKPWFGLLNGLTIALLLAAWQRLSRRWRPSMGDLLPRGRELAVLAALLAVVFLVLGRAIRRDALPGAGPQMTIWFLYGFYLWLAVRTSRRPVPVSPDAPPMILPVALVYFAVALGGVGLVVSAIPHGVLLGMAVESVTGWIVGACLLLSAICAATARED